MKRIVLKQMVQIEILAIIFFICGCDLGVTTNIQDDNAMTNDSERNVLSFNSTEEFLSCISSLAENNLASRKSIRELDGFTSMLDVLPDVDDIDSQNELNNYLSQYPKILIESNIVDADGDEVSIYNMSISPQLAAVVNADGVVEIENTQYNVLNESQLYELSQKCLDCYSESRACSRVIINTPDWLTVFIPMYHGATVGTNYPVKDFKTTINGRSVVVQIWKGFCPGVAIAGGVGAEIGIYNPLWWNKKIWMPDFNHHVSMSYSLVYKGNTYLSMNNTTWWLNGWRVYESAPSTNGNEYTLYYTINGVSRSW